MTRKVIEEIKKRYHCRNYRSLIIEEIRSGLLTTPQARQKYWLTYWQIRHWHRWYYKSRLAPYFQPHPWSSMKNASQEIEQLKKQLADSAARIRQLELEKAVLTTVIQVAEQELKVDIRKKYGTRQSGK